MLYRKLCAIDVTSKKSELLIDSPSHAPASMKKPLVLPIR